MTNFKNKKVFIFDFDGVIFDSTEIKQFYFMKMFESFKVEYAEIEKYEIQNQSRPRRVKIEEIVHQILKLNGDTAQIQIENFLTQYKEYLQLHLPKAKIIKNVNLFLDQISSAKKIIFVLSSAPQDEIEIILKQNHLRKYFKEIIASSQNKAKQIDEIVQKNNYLKKDIIFFGDSLSDQKASEQTQIQFIGINLNYKPEDSVEFYSDFLEITSSMSSSKP